jgi:hypothetical protein
MERTSLDGEVLFLLLVVEGIKFKKPIQVNTEEEKTSFRSHERKKYAFSPCSNQ